MKARFFAAAGLAIGLFAFSNVAANAATVAITGGETRVEVTADLGGLGLAGAPFGTATVDGAGANPVFVFGITGGTNDTGLGTLLIEHNGSGVTLSAGTLTATVGNFLIDTANALVSGDLLDLATGNVVLADVPFFNFGTSTARPGVELLISSALAGALTSTFGAPDLTGAQFGFATPAPTSAVAPIPLPAGGLLLVGALGVLGAASARRKRAA